ncbi:MAG: LysM peptidoglycan-binding domain-containing protein [Lachnospiraceae bacterium]|nr:LysM peptidoglycan-binding domain-containing protein [Lachnospiraceae bacterium]MDY5496435.1 LysM peptidoglycan-binding domain-containing protein [Anaerobutyricum sp.]
MDEKIYLNICQKSGCPGPVHVVKKGDTLYSIAQMHHTRVRVLLDLNPFVDIYNLQPGDEICVPSDGMTEKPELRPYVVKKEDTILSILEKQSVTFEEMAKINKVLTDMKLPSGTILLIPMKKM